MIVTTTDPVTGCKIHDPENHPFLVEGDGEYALKIYFETEDTRQQYLEDETVSREKRRSPAAPAAGLHRP